MQHLTVFQQASLRSGSLSDHPHPSRPSARQRRSSPDPNSSVELEAEVAA